MADSENDDHKINESIENRWNKQDETETTKRLATEHRSPMDHNHYREWEEPDTFSHHNRPTRISVEEPPHTTPHAHYPPNQSPGPQSRHRRGTSEYNDEPHGRRRRENSQGVSPPLMQCRPGSSIREDFIMFPEDNHHHTDAIIHSWLSGVVGGAVDENYDELELRDITQEGRRPGFSPIKYQESIQTYKTVSICREVEEEQSEKPLDVTAPQHRQATMASNDEPEKSSCENMTKEYGDTQSEVIDEGTIRWTKKADNDPRRDE
jgi:hypothetical protein